MKKYYYAIIITLLVSINIVNTYAEKTNDEKSKYIYRDDGQIEFTKEYKINLDSKQSKEKIVNIDFNNYNILPPKECLQKMSVCDETTEIKIISKKTWKLITLEKITSKDLQTHIFAQYYPDIKSKDKINDGTPLQDKLIAQKILYDRGLLPILPTGKIGWLTEIAVMKLQHIKGFEEYDKKKGIVYIGPKTIAELNKLKEKMKDPDYLKKNPLPNINTNNFSDIFKKRLNEIQKMISKTTPNQNALYKNIINADNIKIPPIKPEYLKFEGKAKILKQEE